MADSQVGTEQRNCDWGSAKVLNSFQRHQGRQRLIETLKAQIEKLQLVSSCWESDASFTKTWLWNCETRSSPHHRALWLKLFTVAEMMWKAEGDFGLCGTVWWTLWQRGWTVIFCWAGGETSSETKIRWMSGTSTGLRVILGHPATHCHNFV